MRYSVLATVFDLVAGLVLFVVVGLSLSACAAKQTPPGIEVRTVTKTVEVQRPCAVTVPARPAKLARPLPTDTTALSALLAGKLLEWDGKGGFGDRAEAALATCTKP